MKRKLSNGNNSSGKRARSRKTYKAKRQSKARERVTTVIRAPGPIPPRAIVKMRYAEVVGTNGINIDYLWNLNSTYDPNRSGTRHQPYGRDTYATLYGRYRVYAVSYNIVFATTSGHGYAMIGWDNDTNLRSPLS